MKQHFVDRAIKYSQDLMLERSEYKQNCIDVALWNHAHTDAEILYTSIAYYYSNIAAFLNKPDAPDSHALILWNLAALEKRVEELGDLLCTP